MDELTGLADVRELLASLDEGVEEVSLVLFDVDDLAALNERRGYAWADDLLARLGDVLRGRCGQRDVAARIGGDEFALCLSDADTSDAIHEVESVRRSFREASYGATLSAAICERATLQRSSEGLGLFDAASDALLVATRQRPEGLVVFHSGE